MLRLDRHSLAYPSRQATLRHAKAQKTTQPFHHTHVAPPGLQHGDHVHTRNLSLTIECLSRRLGALVGAASQEWICPLQRPAKMMSWGLQTRPRQSFVCTKPFGIGMLGYLLGDYPGVLSGRMSWLLISGIVLSESKVTPPQCIGRIVHTPYRHNTPSTHIACNMDGVTDLMLKKLCQLTPYVRMYVHSLLRNRTNN